jgi:hypothetical protein
MTLKEQLHKVADNLPPNSSLEYAIERLIFLSKIELGKQQVEDGKVISQQELEKRVKSWQK